MRKIGFGSENCGFSRHCLPAGNHCLAADALGLCLYRVLHHLKQESLSTDWDTTWEEREGRNSFKKAMITVVLHITTGWTGVTEVVF